MFSKKMQILISIIIFSFFILSCPNPASNSTSDNHISILHVGWWIENLPNDIWAPDNSVKPSLTYNFQLILTEGTNKSDLVYARVYLPESTSYWTLDIENNFDSSDSSISENGFWFSESDSILPIGILKAQIKLKNGTTSDFLFTMGRPSSIESDGYRYVYSPEEGTAPDMLTFIPALERATIHSFTKYSNQLIVDFGINGSCVNNGYIWYYDSERTYIGRSPLFLDKLTGLPSHLLLNSTFNHLNNETNICTLGQLDIIGNSNTTVTNEAFDRILYCRVVVTDGLQYTVGDNPRYGSYDYKAISSLSTLSDSSN